MLDAYVCKRVSFQIPPTHVQYFLRFVHSFAAASVLLWKVDTVYTVRGNFYFQLFLSIRKIQKLLSVSFTSVLELRYFFQLYKYIKTHVWAIPFLQNMLLMVDIFTSLKCISLIKIIVKNFLEDCNFSNVFIKHSVNYLVYWYFIKIKFMWHWIE